MILFILSVSCISGVAFGTVRIVIPNLLRLCCNVLLCVSSVPLSRITCVVSFVECFALFSNVFLIFVFRCFSQVVIMSGISVLFLANNMCSILVLLSMMLTM